MKKMPFSMHVDVDKLLPATDAEKEYLVQMRPSTTFFRDGVKPVSYTHLTISIKLRITVCSSKRYFWILGIFQTPDQT